MSNISRDVQETLEDWLYEYCTEFFWMNDEFEGVVNTEEIAQRIMDGIMSFAHSNKCSREHIKANLNLALEDMQEQPSHPVHPACLRPVCG